jgi:mandelate racemase
LDGTFEELTIDGARVRPVEIPLQRPIETAAGPMASVPVVLVDVITREGLMGSSYVRTYTPTMLRAAATTTTDVAALLDGGPADPRAVRERLARHFRLIGIDGLIGIACAAIDMALWDIAAKAAGLPLFRLLGGSRARVPAYGSLSSMWPEAAAAEAEQLAGRGFAAVKLKVGPDIAASLAAIRAVRLAVGPEVGLMVDYNQSLTLASALAHVDELEAEGLVWIEEPVTADDLEAHARIALYSSTPVQLGENLRSAAETRSAVAIGACDGLNFDVQKLGGVSGWLEAAGAVSEARMAISSHAFCEFSSQLLAATPSARWLEYFDHVGTVIEEPLQLDGGVAVLSERAGAGIAWSERAVSRLTKAA